MRFIKRRKKMVVILKRIICGVVILATSLGLCGCIKRLVYIPNEVNEEYEYNNIKQVVVELLNSVKNDENNRFESYFADYVSVMPDFENGKSYVFDIFKGNLLSVDGDLPMGEGENILPKEHLRYAFTVFNIVTDENEYKAFVEIYTSNPNNQYKIKKFKILDKQALENGENFNDTTLRNGIYYPGWIDGLTN
ncbi:MAG: DUF5104 domain-containing protein [Clostridia bacterium]|nr:DUF5104 domain-containing protein [Clostridia bacterium]